jgi:alkylation response protein AidB-like acyl-CoA dehydrogenase
LPKEKGFVISGKKIFVLDGCISDKLIVSARASHGVSDENGMTLFVVPKEAPGLTITPLTTMDGRKAAMVELKNVEAGHDDIIGEIDNGYHLLSEAIDQATVGLCAEMVGGMETVINLTVKYMTDRIQFGKPIGSFQATQHKAADMFIQKELSKSAVYYATGAMVEGVKNKALAVSTAKATCSSAYVDIAKTAVQLHGAYGFTNESDIGLFLKRAKVTEILFGNADYHVERYAKLKGY